MASNNFSDFECATAQTISQVLQARHFSRSQNTFFIKILSLLLQFHIYVGFNKFSIGKRKVCFSFAASDDIYFTYCITSFCLKRTCKCSPEGNSSAGNFTDFYNFATMSLASSRISGAYSNGEEFARSASIIFSL